MKRLLLTVSIISAMLMAACGGASSSGPTSSGGSSQSAQVRTVRVAANNPVKQPGISWLWDGSYLGYYKQEGIQVNIVPTSGPPDALQRLQSGQVDVAVPPPGSVLKAASQGHDLGVVTPFMIRRHGQYQFAVLPDSNIRTAKDISGKKIGVTTLADEGAIYARALAKENGADPSKLTLVPVGDLGQAATELKNHNVDVLSLPTVQYTEIQGLLGFKLKLVPQTKLGSEILGNAVWMRKDFLDKNAGLVEGYLRALAKSVAFFVTNPTAATEISFHMFPDTLPKGQSFSQAVSRQAGVVGLNVPTLQLDGLNCAKYGCNEKKVWDAYAYDYLGVSKSQLPDTGKFYTNRFIDKINVKSQTDSAVQQAKSFKDLNS